MKVSIALATYNGERYLQEQLNSLVDQNRLPDELVICDDGSVDDTLKIIDYFKINAPFMVKVYRNSVRLGYSANFERAISFCKGDVIFLCDQDDVWFPDKLKVVLNTFESEKRALVVINNAVLTDEHLNSSNKLTVIDQTLSAGFTTDSIIVGCCTAFKAELLSFILPVPHDYLPHDSWIHKLSINLKSRIVISQPLQFYRRHGENTSNWFVNRTERVTIFDKIRNYNKGDSNIACMQRMEVLRILYERLSNNRDEVIKIIGSDFELDGILSNIKREQNAIERRLTLLNKKRFLRPFLAWSMFWNGDYRYFSGWMSFVKDLLK